MQKVCWGLALGLLLVSCRQDTQSEGEPPLPPEPPAATGAATPPAAPSPLSGARSVVEETDDFLFEYSYPQEAGNIPELASLLNQRLDRLRNRLAAQSAEGREVAREDGFPFNKYSNEVIWKVVADTPGFLSMSAAISTYTGGAHGNYGFDSLVWDKESGSALKPASFLVSIDALDEVLGEQLCEALNRERAKRRGAAIEDGSDGIFDQCVPLEETTLLLGSSNGRAFNRIGVQIGPYVAGPYAEGSYEFTFDVTGDVLEAVKEDRRSAFATRN